MEPVRGLWNRTTQTLIVLGIAYGVLGSLLLLPVQEPIVALLDWVSHVGFFGPVLFAGIYALSCLLCVPGLVLTLAGGFCFGLVAGVFSVSIGSTVGATLAFLIARQCGRDWLERGLTPHPRLRQLDRAIGSHGFKTVCLLRLSPILPFNLLNFALGLSRVSLRDYVMASWLGMLPSTVLYVYAGTAIKSLTDAVHGRVEWGVADLIFMIVGLVGTFVATHYIGRLAGDVYEEDATMPSDQPIRSPSEIADKPIAQSSDR